MKSSHLQIIMGAFATLVQKDKFAQLSVRAGNLHATTTIQNPVKEIVTEKLSEYKATWRGTSTKKTTLTLATTASSTNFVVTSP